MAASAARRPPVLGLDLALACGWALVEGDKVVRSGRWMLAQAEKHPGDRYLALVRALDAGGWPDHLLVAYEDVRSHRQRDKASGREWFATTGAQVYGGLKGIVLAWAARRRHDVKPIGVGSWKSGLGLRSGAHAAKDDVMQRVRLLGFAPVTQDEADAIGIALHAWRTAGLNVAL